MLTRMVGGFIRAAWSPNDIEALKSLVAEKRTGTQAAAVLGVSRNAAIGKAHRLGLKFEGQPPRNLNGRPRSERGGTKRPRVRKQPTHTPSPERRRIGEPVSRKLPVYQLDFINDCRFPTSEEAPHVHCGHPRLTPGRDHISVYCEYHTILTRNQNHRQRGTGHGHLVYWSARLR